MSSSGNGNPKNVEKTIQRPQRVNTSTSLTNKEEDLKEKNLKQQLKNYNKTLAEYERDFKKIYNEQLNKLDALLNNNKNLTLNSLPNYEDFTIMSNIMKNIEQIKINNINKPNFNSDNLQKYKSYGNTFNQRQKKKTDVNQKKNNLIKSLKEQVNYTKKFYIEQIQKIFKNYTNEIKSQTIEPLQKLSSDLETNMRAIRGILTQLENKESLNKLTQIDLTTKYPDYVKLKNNYLNAYEKLNEVQQQYIATLERLKGIITDLGGTTELTYNLTNVNNKKENIKKLNENINKTKESIIGKLTESKGKYADVLDQIKGLCGNLKETSKKYTQLKTFYNNKQLNVEPFSSILKTIKNQTEKLNSQLTNNSCKKVFNLFKTGNGNGNGVGTTQATPVNRAKYENNNANNANAHRQLRNLFSPKSYVQQLKNLVANKPNNINSNITKKQQHKSKIMELLNYAMKEVAQNKTTEIEKLQAKKNLITRLMTNGHRKKIIGEKLNNIKTNNGLKNFSNTNNFFDTLVGLPPPPTKTPTTMPTATTTMPPQPPTFNQAKENIINLLQLRNNNSTISQIKTFLNGNVKAGNAITISGPLSPELKFQLNEIKKSYRQPKNKAGTTKTSRNNGSGTQPNSNSSNHKRRQSVPAL
jgi:hypothetical protein